MNYLKCNLSNFHNFEESVFGKIVKIRFSNESTEWFDEVLCEKNFGMEGLKYYEFFNKLTGLPSIVENEKNPGKKELKILLLFYQRMTEVIVVLIRLGFCGSQRILRRLVVLCSSCELMQRRMLTTETGVLSQILAVPSVWFDMNILCACLSSAAHSLQVLLKTIYLNYYRKEFIRFVKMTMSVQKRCEEFEERNLKEKTSFTEYYLKQSRYVRLLLIAHFIIMFCSTSAYFLPFVYDSLINYDTVEDQLPPIVVQLPFDINCTPQFQMVVLLLTACFYLNNLKTVVIDNFILSLIVLGTSLFRFQKQLLGRFVSEHFPENEWAESASPPTEEKKNMVRDWIVLHQESLKGALVLEKIMSPYLLLEFSYVLIHTCVPAFVITSTFSWTMAQKMAVFFIVGGGLVQLLVVSKAGDSFTQSWETVDADLFRPSLYGRKEKWMFHVFTVVKGRLNVPFRLNAYTLFPLRCATFATISRLIVSHYVTLNQIQTLKSGKNEVSSLN